MCSDVDSELEWALGGGKREKRSNSHVSHLVSPAAGPTYAEISGPSVVRLTSGSAFSLECQVSSLLLLPKHLYWTHNELVLTPQNRPGLSLESEKLSGFSISKLVLVDVGPEDAGTYACVTDVTPPEEVELMIGKIISRRPPLLTTSALVVAFYRD